MQIDYLSHPITESMSIYGGNADLDLVPVKNIVQGDSCNSWRFRLENHWGTHVDCPAHFFVEGAKVVDYPPEFWWFRSPQVIQIEAKPGQVITRENSSCDLDPETDLVLFQSGWGRFRGKEIYIRRNPGLHPSLGLWLRAHFPSVRAIGIDWISISSFEHRDVGREAHKAFLAPDGKGHPILIIEDMNLSGDLHDLKEVWVAPLLIEGIDSAPCTVIGIFEEKSECRIAKSETNSNDKERKFKTV